MLKFIDQVDNSNFKFSRYLLYVIPFMLLMLFNYIFSNEEESANYIKSVVASRGKTMLLVELMLPFVFFLGGLLLWVKYAHKQSIKSLTTSRKKIDWKRVFFSFTVWGLFSSSMLIVAYISDPSALILNFELIPFFKLLAVALVMIPIQTSFEEYLFRGYLMQGLGVKTRSVIIPLLVTSVFFGLAHAANPEVGTLGTVIMVYYIGTGLFLGLLTVMDGGIELSLGFHCANNLFAALLVTTDWAVFQTDAVFIDTSEPNVFASIVVPVFIVYPLLLIFYSKKYKWNSFGKELLRNNS